jgi:hypothetical protein
MPASFYTECEQAFSINFSSRSINFAAGKQDLNITVEKEQGYQMSRATAIMLAEILITIL